MFVCTLNASKVIFVAFNLNSRLDAVFVGKPAERMTIFWTVQFFKRNLNRFSIFHTPLLTRDVTENLT